MSDLVERLRTNHPSTPTKDRYEAADRLEQLEDVLREVTDLAEKATGFWRSELDVGDDWSEEEQIIAHAREAMHPSGPSSEKPPHRDL